MLGASPFVAPYEMPLPSSRSNPSTCRRRHETPHAMNLFDMHQKYADVLGIDEVVAHLATLTVKEPAYT